MASPLLQRPTLPPPLRRNNRMIENLNYLVALGTVALQIVTVVLLALFFVREDFPFISGLVARWGAWLAFLLTLFSTGMSLFYSNVLGVATCYLCWLERAFIYPQMVLFALALWKRETVRIADYAIGLSIVGAIISLYQHYIQMVGESPLPCPASGGDCIQRFFFEFGYVTFPLVAFSAFAFIIVVMLFVRKNSKEVLQ